MFNALNSFLKSIIDIINGVMHNYGWSIIIFTLFLRLILWPFDIKQRRSMKKITDLQPKIDEINKKYKNDEDKKTKKTMELYKKEKANPLGGCLPTIIPLIILFALFAVLRQIADQQLLAMFHAAQSGKAVTVQSWLWVHNIWQPDSFMSSVLPTFQEVSKLSVFKGISQAVYNKAMSIPAQAFKGLTNGYFILPVLAGLTQYYQMKITNAGGSAQQQQQQKIMMYIFPLFSVWICSTYNAGFSIYWVSSNIIQIGQQYLTDLIYPDLAVIKKEDKK